MVSLWFLFFHTLKYISFDLQSWIIAFVFYFFFFIGGKYDLASFTCQDVDAELIIPSEESMIGIFPLLYK